MKKWILILIGAFLVFCGFVGYNYWQAQKAIRETRPAPLEISLLTYPGEIAAGKTATFTWDVEASPDLLTPRTTIYWGYVSTPSALTRNDSPEAVAYQYHQSDYYKGLYKLPDTFSLEITFPKAGKIFFRAYAKVGDNNLWTDEKTLIVDQTNNVGEK